VILSAMKLFTYNKMMQTQSVHHWGIAVYVVRSPCGPVWPQLGLASCVQSLQLINQGQIT
jgi:hypothetical protein